MVWWSKLAAWGSGGCLWREGWLLLCSSWWRLKRQSMAVSEASDGRNWSVRDAVWSLCLRLSAFVIGLSILMDMLVEKLARPSCDLGWDRTSLSPSWWFDQQPCPGRLASRFCCSMQTRCLFGSAEISFDCSTTMLISARSWFSLQATKSYNIQPKMARAWLLAFQTWQKKLNHLCNSEDPSSQAEVWHGFPKMLSSCSVHLWNSTAPEQYLLYSTCCTWYSNPSCWYSGTGSSIFLY